MVISICILVLLLIASVVDIRKKEVLSWEIAGFGVVSLLALILDLYHGSFSPLDMAMSTLPGVMLIAAAFITGEGIGYGDGLLVLFMGPALGLYRVGAGLVLAFFFSSIFSALILFSKRVGRKKRIPFIPFIALGTGVAVFAAI